jgi:hypothetical protein
MYELSSALTNARTQDGIAYTVPRFVRQLFQAAQVNVTFQQSKMAPRITVSEPQEGEPKGKPDRILALLNAWGWVGEIQIWRGEFSDLPEEDSFLLQNFASQTARAFKRTETMNGARNATGLSQNIR